MTTKRQLKFLFQEPGMLEAVAREPQQSRTGKQVLSRGYSDSGIPDLMADYRLDADHPFAWISYNFEKFYPVIIWSLKLDRADELFDVPQAGLTVVPLHEAFSWAYTHFILEASVQKTGEAIPVAPSAYSSLYQKAQLVPQIA